MKPTRAQERAINELLERYYSSDNNTLLNAPTGSGKTFIIASFISRLIELNTKKKLVFVIATLSSSQLPEQFAKKINKYNDYFNEKLNVEYKEPPSNKSIGKFKDLEPSMIPLENKVFIVGKSSFTKNTIFIKRGIFDSFLQQIEYEGYTLVYIRDEAHYGNVKEKLIGEDKNFEQKINDQAKFVVEMTASPSPKDKTDSQVIIYPDELVGPGQHLIKQTPKINKGLSKLGIDSINDDDDLLSAAINQFKIIKKQYGKFSEEMFCEINPAMLIQVDSKTEKKAKNFEENLINIKEKLTKSNLSWYQYFGDWKESSGKEKLTLDEISQIDSPVDVIIFKVGPATGWDIPRANMLVQMRKVNSMQLGIQTLGRIKRNPSPDLSYHTITDEFYLYSNYQSPIRNLETYVIKKDKSNVLIANGIIESETITKEHFKQSGFNDWFNKNISSVEETSFFKDIYQNDFNNTNAIILSDENFIEDNRKFAYYKEKIIDMIDIAIYNNELKNDNLDYYNMTIDNIKEFIDKNKLDFDKSLFIFNRYYRKKMMIIFESKINEIIKTKYKISVKSLPASYSIWEEKNKIPINFKQINDVYAYKNITKNKNYLQTLDSMPEIVVMRKIISIVLGYPQINLFAKNPVFSGASFEYINDQMKISQSYLDFIIKLDDISILIEVKGYGKRDYDNEKTNHLRRAYKEYAKVSNDCILVIASVDEHDIPHYEFFSNRIEIIEGNPLDISDLLILLI